MPRLNFTEEGKGNPIILIHGFPMNNEVWNPFTKELTPAFKVITIDLPGFGKSPIVKSPFTLADVAEEISIWLSEKQIVNGVLIGHSLGGYVALNLIKRNPEKFSGFGLFHSTAYPDSDEKKISRTKVIDFIDKHGVQAFTSNFIAPLFSNQDHPAIEKVKKMAIQSSAEAVKGYTLAMRDRPSYLDVIEKFQKPILFISGEKDNGIPVETVLAQSLLAKDPEVHVLEGVAHMGMFENPDETARIIRSFSMKCFQ